MIDRTQLTYFYQLQGQIANAWEVRHRRPHYFQFIRQLVARARAARKASGAYPLAK